MIRYCSEPGCHARVQDYEKCSRHRPKKKYSGGHRPAETQRETWNRKRRRVTPGLPAGWEGV